jgi:Tol biopolymer transport system component
VPRTDTTFGPPGYTLRTAESAIGWIDHGRTLVFSHVNTYVSGPYVFEVECKGGGVFALDRRTGTVRKLLDLEQRVRNGHPCVLIGEVAEASLGAARQLLFGDRDDGVRAVNLDTDSETVLGPQCEDGISAPRLSRDHKMIVVVWSCDQPHGSRLGIMRADGSDPHGLGRPDTSVAAHPSWSPDGRRIAYERDDGSVTQHRRITVIDSGGTGATTVALGTSPEWGPTGQWIAYEPDSGIDAFLPAIHVVHPDGTGDHAVYDARTACHCSPIPVWNVPDAPQRPFRWTPDGHSIVFTVKSINGSRLESVDIRTGAITRLTGY